MELILFVLLLAPRTAVTTAEKTQPVVGYADLIVEIAGEEAHVVELKLGKFDKPTSLPRYRGRFEARAQRGKETLERVAFDFPLHAEAETDDFADEERALAKKLRAGVRARTRVRVPLPQGCDVIQVYDTKLARAITVPLKAPAPSPPPAGKVGAPRAR